MTTSLHSAASKTFLPMLANLAHILSTAEAWATEKKIDPAVLLGDRLAPDMLPLKAQIAIACDHAKSALYRIAGEDVPSVPDTETTFADYQARIAKTLELFHAVSADKVNGREEAPVVLKMRFGELNMTGETYLFCYAFPNFYFHVTTAYNILRHNGVPLGKGDFLKSR